MAANIEIKAKCRDLAAAKLVAERIGAEYIGVYHQTDTYFQVRTGRLKLRESDKTGAQLIPYLRPDAGQPRRSDYHVIAVPHPKALKDMLSRILGVSTVVEKRREVYLKDKVRIHLDDVRNLGTFIEFEAMTADDSAGAERDAERKVRDFMRAFDIRPDDVIDVSYCDLLGVCRGDTDRAT